MEEVTALASDTCTILTFAWNTTGFGCGNYALSAYVWPVPSETETADNNFTGGLVNVVFPGGVEGNRRVNMGDISSLCNGFGATIGPDGNYWHHPPGILDPFSPNLDINGNGKNRHRRHNHSPQQLRTTLPITPSFFLKQVGLAHAVSTCT